MYGCSTDAVLLQVFVQLTRDCYHITIAEVLLALLAHIYKSNNACTYSFDLIQYAHSDSEGKFILNKNLS